MNNDNLSISQATEADVEDIYNLYRCVSSHVGGLARIQSEITHQYVSAFSSHAAHTGVQLIVRDVEKNNALIAEIHCYKLEPAVFSHVLSELTIAVNPQYQGMGVGKRLFTHLLNYVEKHRHDIHRIELITRESNTRAIALYEKLGFRIEGRLRNRIRIAPNLYEDDIIMGWLRQ